MTTRYRCDGCGATAGKEGTAGWLRAYFSDEDGSLGRDCIDACSVQCLLTLAMDENELFSELPIGVVTSD